MQISDKCTPGISELPPLTRMSARAIDKTYWLILQIIMTPTLRTTKMPLPLCSYGLKRMSMSLAARRHLLPLSPYLFIETVLTTLNHLHRIINISTVTTRCRSATTSASYRVFR